MAYLTHRPAKGTMLRGFGAPPATPTSPLRHFGQDYGWGAGYEVYAARGGTVKSYAPSGAYGNRLVIDHGGGIETWYCHLSAIAVRVGAVVKAGQRVGTMGASGNVTGPHLHFELRVKSVAVDPALYFTTTAGLEPEPLQGDDDMPKLIRHPSGTITTVGETTYQHHSWDTYVADRAVWGDFKQLTAEEYARVVANTQVRKAYLLAGVTGGVVDAVAIAAKVEQNLADDFARLSAEIASVNANIDDQPVEFVVSPR